MNEKVFGMIGMAKRAGKLSCGEAAVKKAIRQGMAKLVIISEDASENTKKSVKNSCAFYNIEYIENGHMEQLGHSIGTGYAAAVSVNDDNFAKAVSDKINLGKNGKDD